MTIFDLLDYFPANRMLPLVAIAVCIYVGHILPKSFLEREMTNNGSMKSLIFPALVFVVRYVSPLLIAIVFINKIIESL